MPVTLDAEPVAAVPAVLAGLADPVGAVFVGVAVVPVEEGSVAVVAFEELAAVCVVGLGLVEEVVDVAGLGNVAEVLVVAVIPPPVVVLTAPPAVVLMPPSAADMIPPLAAGLKAPDGVVLMPPSAGNEMPPSGAKRNAPDGDGSGLDDADAPAELVRPAVADIVVGAVGMVAVATGCSGRGPVLPLALVPPGALARGIAAVNTFEPAAAGRPDRAGGEFRAGVAADGAAGIVAVNTRSGGALCACLSGTIPGSPRMPGDAGR